MIASYFLDAIGILRHHICGEGCLEYLRQEVSCLRDDDSLPVIRLLCYFMIASYFLDAIGILRHHIYGEGCLEYIRQEVSCLRDDDSLPV